MHCIGQTKISCISLRSTAQNQKRSCIGEFQAVLFPVLFVAETISLAKESQELDSSLSQRATTTDTTTNTPHLFNSYAVADDDNYDDGNHANSGAVQAADASPPQYVCHGDGTPCQHAAADWWKHKVTCP